MVVLGCSKVIAGSRPAISPLSRRKKKKQKRKKNQKEKQKRKKKQKKKKNKKKKNKHKKTKKKTKITHNEQKHSGLVACSGVVQRTHSGRSRPIQCTTPPKGLCSAKKRLCRGCFL